jgi:hypothetical protein
MPLLDRAFYLLDSPHSPQDFTLILHLNDAPEVDRFYAGAKSATNRFPISACCVDGPAWVWRENKYFALEIVTSASAIERFIDEPFDLRRQPPVRQMLILDGGVRLATRFHHSAADGLSAALWLGHQLNVAYGFEAAQSERGEFNGLALRRSAMSVRRSQFAFDGASDRLWTANLKRSGARRWLTIGFPATELQKVCRRAGGFTYNDLLATCTLEVLRRWNANHGRPRRAAPTNKLKIHRRNCRGGTPWPPVVVEQGKIGLWMPMNIRRNSGEGFGNGTSRIRVYAKYDPDAKLIEKCREVRRQVSWTSEHGEWVVPELPWFTRLPPTIIGPLLRGYLNRASVDMATGVFSHATTGMANACEAFKHVERIESVGLLHPRQRLAINGATHHGHTWLTLTYDPAQLTIDDINELSGLYEEQIALARQELSVMLTVCGVIKRTICFSVNERYIACPT